ncbi:hypothetical protein [Pseudomonas typographi]|uniref:hypothetical protein n=1 Tax=Pseudomonas typographi TaxID=2715964 RepID=UPI001EEEEDBD|nr:hypothetical protein [Pseudomonas typographi]
MARIPSYQRQVAPEVAQAPRALGAGVDASGLAQGVENLAGSMYQVHQKEVAEANQTALINADNQLGTWQNKALFDPEAGAFTKKGSGALNITKTTLDQYDQQSQGILESLANPEQKRMFQQAALARRGSLQEKLGSYEFGQQQAYKDDVDKSSIQLSMDSAALNYNDPQAIEQNRLKMNAVLDQRAERLGWSPEERQAQLQSANSSLSHSVIQRMVIDSPQKARSLYDQYKDSMTADDQIRATSTIDQAFKRQEAEARQRLVEQRQLQAISRQELSGRVQDAQAAYLQGLQFDNPPNLADFKQAYGDKAGEHYEQFKKVQDIAPAIQEFATATPQERKDILAKFKPGADGTAGEGFAEDSQLYQHLVTVGTGLMKQQQQDPATYVAQYSAPVRQALAQAQKDGTPEAYSAYFTATAAEQRRQGVQTVKLLPDAMADQLAANFNSKVAAGDSDNAAQLIEQMQAQWGKNFGPVIQQLGNKLPAEAQVIATGLPADIAQQMAAVAPIKDEELNKGLQQGQAKEIQQSVATAMTDFAQTLRGQAGGIDTYNTMYNTAVRTATAYVLQGMPTDKAVQKVASGMVNDKYDFFDTYRVPKALDTSSIRRGADRALGEISGADLMPLPGLRGVTPEENARQLESAVRDGGEWVTNGDETGLTLTVNGYAIRGKDGKLVQRTWQQLQGLGIQATTGKEGVVYPWTVTP